MPIYEYQCKNCHRKSSHFFRSFSATSSPRCPHCQSDDLVRLISRVVLVKGDARRVQELDPNRALSGLDSTNLASVAHWARQVGREMDAELGSRFTEMAEQMEAGQTPPELYDPAYALQYA